MAKVAQVVYAQLAIFSVYWLIYRSEIKHQLLWLAAIMVCSNAFYSRMNMGKAPTLTIIITVLGIQLVSGWFDSLGERVAWLLAPGPLLGLIALRPVLGLRRA